MASNQENDSRIDRRSLLGTAFRGISGLALASMLARDGVLKADDLHSQARPVTHFDAKSQNCIFFFMWGGPSQLDMYDFKPTLNKFHGKPIPDEIAKNATFAFAQKETARLQGSAFEFKPCGQSGIQFSELLPNLSGCADLISLIKTTHTDSFNHRPGQILMNTGFTRVGRPSVGAWLHYGLGSQSQDLPGFIVLQSGNEVDGGASNWSSGFLPSAHQGVALRREGPPILNLDLPSNVDSVAHRRSLDAIVRLNQMRFQQSLGDDIRARITNYELGFRMQSAAPELFDLSKETSATLTAYGVDRETDEEKSFARNCLLARRMVERGVRFVNVFMGDWDSHFHLNSAHRRLCKAVDQPIAALLQDLKARGLLESTLVVWASEFGRTPIGENRDHDPEASGRDHHPSAFTTWMAGGGCKAGVVVGETDELGWNPVSDPVHVNDFHATLLHLFGMDHKRFVYRFQGRDYRLTDVGGRVVDKLLA